MESRTADTTVIIPIEEYVELIETRARFYTLASQFRELKAQMDERNKPFFGGKEAEHETNS